MQTITLLDLRGLSCPQPVMQARQAIQAAALPLEILVDTVTARENVRRMAEHSGCRVQIENDGDDFKLIITR